MHLSCCDALNDLGLTDKAVAMLPSMAIYPQRLFCHELFVIGQPK